MFKNNKGFIVSPKGAGKESYVLELAKRTNVKLFIVNTKEYSKNYDKRIKK